MKKSEKANLENKKTIFFQIGLIFSLTLALLAFEWTGSAPDYSALSNNAFEVISLELPPVTRRKELIPPPPIIPSESFVITTVEIDDDKEFIVFETEATEETAIITNSFFNQDDEKEDGEVFIIVEDMPTFQGGDLTKFWQYVQSNIHYPEVAKENGIHGTVFVSFVVNKNGDVEDIQIMRSVDKALDNEVIRTIRNAPKWKAGEQRGKKVNVSFAMNIKFVLN